MPYPYDINGQNLDNYAVFALISGLISQILNFRLWQK